MLESPIFPEIDNLFSFYGLELDDLVVALGLFSAVETLIGQANPHIGRVGITLYLTFGAVGILFAVWRAFKAGRPRHFLEDLLGLLTEPDVWVLTGDRDIRPSYIIEPDGRVTRAPSD